MNLRPFATADFAELMTWFPTEASLIQWGGPTMTFPLDHAQLAAMLAEGQSVPPARRLWVAVHDGTIVGHAQVALDHRHGVARLSRVSIAPSRRGQGLAHRFLVRIIEHTFVDLNIERLELVVYTFNEAALKTYRRLGFVAEGVRRASVRVGTERWDTALLAILRDERVRNADIEQNC